MPRKVTLAIAETVHYAAEFTVEELNEICRSVHVATLDEVGGDVQAWLQDEVRGAVERVPGMLEQIEHDSGDVQESTWKWAVVPDAS
jgi:hypothetical protein